MPRWKRYEACGCSTPYQKPQQLRDFLTDVFGAQWTATEVTPTHIRVHVPLPHGEEIQLEPNQEERAWVQLWAMRNEGLSLRTNLYSNPLTAIKAPRAIMLEQRRALSPPPPRCNPCGGPQRNRYIANCCELTEKVALMWGTLPPQLPMAWAAHRGIFIDGTTVGKRSYVHFTLGDLRA